MAGTTEGEPHEQERDRPLPHPPRGGRGERAPRRDVYAALAEADPGDFRYTTYRLADGVTFVHVAHQDGPENPLQTLPAFAEFQRELQERCAEPPAPSEATVVGSYGWPS